MRSIHLGVFVAATLIASACASGSGTSPMSTLATVPSSAGMVPIESVASSTQPSDKTVQITVGTDTDADLRFDRDEVTVQAGASVRVTFENRASVPHNLTFQTPINVGTSTVVSPATAETLDFTAPDAGKYAFACTLHPGMGGTLVVIGSQP